MAPLPQQKLIYFVSGMWCSTCAKNVGRAVARIDGVASADVNYASKLLFVETHQTTTPLLLDQQILARVARIGFGIKKQSEGWVLNFHESLKKESSQKISWTQVSVVWFLAMWSSMLAFASYSGGDLTQDELFYLALGSSALGLPAILLGILPYANSGLRALWFSKILTLDLFIFVGGCSAIGISVSSLLANSHITYADSGSMIVAILLLTKKIENTIVTSVTSNILFQLHPDSKTVEACLEGTWIHADISRIRRDDLVRIWPEETVPFDGILQSDGVKINNHLITGESTPVFLKKGDDIFAGAIAQDNLEILVSSPLGERKIDTWAEAALASGGGGSKYAKIFSRIESGIVIFAFGGAVLIASIQAIQGAPIHKIVESFFVGILIFCPCLFASIIPLMKQMVHLTLLKSGVMLFRDDALLDLPKVKNFYFDKTGTLEAVESNFIAYENENNAAIPYLIALAEKSKHALFRGLKLVGKAKTIDEFTEYPGKGLVATASDGTKIVVGRPSFLKETGLSISDCSSGFSLVSINQKTVGQIVRKSVYDLKSMEFLKNLLSVAPEANIEILSGDPAAEAGMGFAELDKRITYHGNLSPEEKANLICGASAFVGDGLNDTLALAKAQVSFRVGHRIQGFAPVDFQLKTPDIDLILKTLEYSKKYRKVLIQMGVSALFYNLTALTLAGLGKFSPLGAVLSMLASFSLMLLSAFRLRRV